MTVMVNSELADLIRYSVYAARKVFQIQKRIRPMFHYVTSTGEHRICLIPEALLKLRDDGLVDLFMQHVLRRHDAVAVIQVAEAWLLHMSGDQVDASGGWKMVIDGMDNHPDREKVLFFLAQDDEQLIRVRIPVHGEGDEASLGEAEVDEVSHVATCGSASVFLPDPVEAEGPTEATRDPDF